MKPQTPEAKTLYQEITNDRATWVDAVFWMVIGSVVGGIVQALTQSAIEGWAK